MDARNLNRIRHLFGLTAKDEIPKELVERVESVEKLSEAMRAVPCLHPHLLAMLLVEHKEALAKKGNKKKSKKGLTSEYVNAHTKAELLEMCESRGLDAFSDNNKGELAARLAEDDLKE